MTNRFIKAQTKNTERREMQRDRATVQAEARKINSSDTSEAERAKAVVVLSKTVLKGAGLSTTGDSGTMLGKLAADLVASPATVIGLGIQDAIRLKVSAEDA